MYETYWELTDKPFRNTPDPRYFYFSRQHEEALARMLYAITEGQGAMLLTGEYGCGKTLLSRALLAELDATRFEVALITYPQLSALEFLQQILHQFGFPTDGRTKAQLLQMLHHALLENHRQGRATLIVVDEAQMVRDEATLEEIRLLLNFQQEKKFYLTLLLMGQPELRERVRALPQLLQRLSVRYHLGPLGAEDGRRYLAHRLRLAGADDSLFTREAERLLVEAAGGVPRRINSIADMALLVGFGQRAPLVDEPVVRQVVADLESGRTEDADHARSCG